MVDLTEPCTLWQRTRQRKAGSVGVARYPVMRIDGKVRTIHRRACEEANGPPPTSKHNALHACNTPSCRNGKHLYWGTQQDNLTQAAEEGRMRRKLTENEVRAIRASTLQGKHLADVYGISTSMVCAIRKRRVWKWLEDK